MPFEDCLSADDDVAFTVSPSDADTITDVMAAGGTEEAEDVASKSRPMLKEARSAVNMRQQSCFDIELGEKLNFDASELTFKKQVKEVLLKQNARNSDI